MLKRSFYFVKTFSRTPATRRRLRRLSPSRLGRCRFGIKKPAAYAAGFAFKLHALLPNLDSNQDTQIQKLMYYPYTIGQSLSKEWAGGPLWGGKYTIIFALTKLEKTMGTIKLGWVGLGRMGTPMAQQLLKAGEDVTVYNRSTSKEGALGAKTAGTPRELAQAADVVFIMVSDDQATRDVFVGQEGLLKGGRTDRVFINMSTVSPEVSREMAAKCVEQGNHYVDAPVSGSVKQAEEGQLVVMVGAGAELFERVKPLLAHLGKLVLRVGDTGVGNTAKLAINTLLAIHAQGLAEAVLFAGKNGVREEDFLTIVNNGALSNVFAKIKGEAILKGNFQAAFALKHIAKDLRLAKAEGLDTPLAETAYKTYQAAEPTLGEEDIIAVIKAVGGETPVTPTANSSSGSSRLP